jgi:hypothetical protein
MQKSMVRLVNTKNMLAQQFNEPLDAVVARGEYVVSVAPGYSKSDALVEQLISALTESGASLAIASPFARGGRLRGPSWLARAVTSWENGFLSLAAHGELATVIGTVRVYRRDALARVLQACAGIDLDCEIALEARQQRIGIIEVPAELSRSRDAEISAARRPLAALSRSWRRLRTGLRYRPALWLALPGLVPGLLPLTVALLFIVHATPAQAAFWTIATLVIQYGSLALFSWQTSTFVAKRWLRQRPP